MQQDLVERPKGANSSIRVVGPVRSAVNLGQARTISVADREDRPSRPWCSRPSTTARTPDDAQRGEDPSHKAAEYSNYYLTGKIKCPKCGRNYLGTVAHGKSRNYRYYTCFTRSRYGVDHCNAPRIHADKLDQQALAMLLDFYTNHTQLLTEAINTSQTRHQQARITYQTEIDKIDKQLVAKQATVDRYLTDYEQETLDRETIAPRIEDLAAQIKELRHRRDQLAMQIDLDLTQPEPPDLDKVRTQITEIITEGDPNQHKALCQTAIAHIHINGSTGQLNIKVPTNRTATQLAAITNPPATTKP